MIISKRFYSLIAVFILSAVTAYAQNKPIGYWDAYLPYNSSVSIATDGVTIFNGCDQGFYTYNTVKQQFESYSKVNGMSDIGIQCVSYDAFTSTAVLVYTDGNIDLFKDNTFYNLPDLKIQTLSGNKTVYHVYTENGIAYLSSALGVIVLDLTKHNILETYQFISNGGVAPVYDFTGVADSFYAVTSAGLYRAWKNSPDLQNFAIWQLVDNAHTFSDIVNLNSRVYLSNSSKVYELVSDTIQTVYVSDSIIEHIDAGFNVLFISQYIPHTYSGYITVLGLSNQAIDSFPCPGVPAQSIQLADSSIWVGDTYNGLEKRINKTGNQTAYLPVPGPVDANSFDIYANNQDVWVAHGTYNDKYAPGGHINGFSHFNNNSWFNYGRDRYFYPFDTSFDYIAIAKDPATGKIYAGSIQSGLMILNPNGSLEVIKSNSIFDKSLAYLSGTQRQIVGVAIDPKSDIVWVSEMYPQHQHQLYALTPDSNWYKFSLPCMGSGGPMLIDDNSQVWFSSLDGLGVGVYNTNNTISDPSDDTWYCLQSGVGSGNLPSNLVFCLAKDQNNNIWIGTSNGIGIASNCSAPFTQSPPCDVQIPIVQYDQYAGYLFAGYNVRSIAVDGANRKWVGTDNGVWLLSPDASKIIYQFNQDNSPLPSNFIQKIAIDQVTGDVYIGTDQGLVSYRSTATQAGTSNSNVTIFPDPVPSGYTGTIAIKGLVANADVRITDISGQLVYRTTALGGQAIWNGIDYKGHRPQSGVYLVFASSSDGSQTYSGKMVFMQ